MVRTSTVHDIRIAWVGLEQRKKVVGDDVALSQEQQGLPIICKIPPEKAVDVFEAFCTSVAGRKACGWLWIRSQLSATACNSLRCCSWQGHPDKRKNSTSVQSRK
jgi:hypothetical protein